jgi:hypothetical protein
MTQKQLSTDRGCTATPATHCTADREKRLHNDASDIAQRGLHSDASDIAQQTEKRGCTTTPATLHNGQDRGCTATPGTLHNGLQYRGCTATLAIMICTPGECVLL